MGGAFPLVFGRVVSPRARSRGSDVLKKHKSHDDKGGDIDNNKTVKNSLYMLPGLMIDQQMHIWVESDWRYGICEGSEELFIHSFHSDAAASVYM